MGAWTPASLSHRHTMCARNSWEPTCHANAPPEALPTSLGVCCIGLWAISPLPSVPAEGHPFTTEARTSLGLAFDFGGAVAASVPSLTSAQLCPQHDHMFSTPVVWQGSQASHPSLGPGHRLRWPGGQGASVPVPGQCWAPTLGLVGPWTQVPCGAMGDGTGTLAKPQRLFCHPKGPAECPVHLVREGQVAQMVSR